MVVAAQEVGGQEIDFGWFGKDRIQTDGAGKERATIGYPPRNELVCNVFGRSARQQSRKALRFEIIGAKFGGTICEVLALLDPAQQSFPR